MKESAKRILLCLLAGLLWVTAIAAAEPTVTAQPQATEEPTDSPKPAKGYVLVTTATQSGWLPLPEEGEVSYPLRQLLPNGTEAVNTIHLTPEGVYMEDSTCEGHDCVQQGEVTLDNRAERILGNMIICLPNQVTLQLYTPEELLEMVKGQ
ncbi:MAG: NusG domain II-containing protein [Clostridia bacterium]|nr:NusG domain II-containing protein [Clostridia bacterium]MBQ9039516.1 NusG domain II-containing protein [Clostridia bacterium]